MIVALTREVGHNDALRTWLGADVDVREVPLTETHFLEHETVAHELASLENYGRFASLVITSARTSEYLELARAALGNDADVFSVGPATSQVLVCHGVTPRAQSSSRALELAPLIVKGPVLFLGASQAREELADDLSARGYDVAIVACYETLPVALSEHDAAVLHDADVVLIGAPSAWAVARELVNPSTWVIVPGVSTGDVVRSDHERVLEGWGPALGDVVNSLAP
jgi:uroporphyrinogen-III synthase